MEAWGLGAFMVAAGVAVVLMESPDAYLHGLIANADLRRTIIGLAMGFTAVGIIYSRWGQQSGAHINPAVTLAFLRLGKIAKWDALFYVLAQFIGGTLGVLLVLLLFQDRFSLPPVDYVQTRPGPDGIWVAFTAEILISLLLMLTVLAFMNSERFARLTGLAAGALVAVFIIIEAPLSGMSMNPARSFASAAPAGDWNFAWIYFTAPILGMLLAIELYRFLHLSTTRMCAKLDHPRNRRCIHCGYEPATDTKNPRKRHSV